MPYMARWFWFIRYKNRGGILNSKNAATRRIMFMFYFWIFFKVFYNGLCLKNQNHTTLTTYSTRWFLWQKNLLKSHKRLNLMQTFDKICNELGVPLSVEKWMGPIITITYLGLEIDSISQMVKVPLEKIRKAKTVSFGWEILIRSDSNTYL